MGCVTHLCWWKVSTAQKLPPPRTFSITHKSLPGKNSSKKPGDRHVCAQQKINQTPRQASSGSGFYSPLSEVRLALFDTKLNVFICPSQKLQQRRKYIGSGSIKAANQPLGRLATQHLGRLPRFAIFNTWEYPALARLNASHI